jgi:Rps23 Pro-64 3,4-dihydroxylase Tpa1-like proline 4-hydroxylase
MSMADITYPVDPRSYQIDIGVSKAVGERYREQYLSGKPYNHIKLDDFIDPQILEQVLREFPSSPGQVDEMYMRAQERLKVSYKPELLSDYSRLLFYFFNSVAFVAFLESLTGIKGLIPDPYFIGGGLHEVKNGGHLDIHADFNHHVVMNLERRINVLIYLNKDWKPEFGGQFEIWNEDMATRAASFDPLFNRCVIFNTSSNSYHGNPNPVARPDNISRKSIALYYYTATWDRSKRKHTTQFKRRPESEDKTDWYVRVKELVADITPPLLFRGMLRAKHLIADRRKPQAQ